MLPLRLGILKLLEIAESLLLLVDASLDLSDPNRRLSFLSRARVARDESYHVRTRFAPLQGSHEIYLNGRSLDLLEAAGKMRFGVLAAVFEALNVRIDFLGEVKLDLVAVEMRRVGVLSEEAGGVGLVAEDALFGQVIEVFGLQGGEVEVGAAAFLKNGL